MVKILNKHPPPPLQKRTAYIHPSLISSLNIWSPSTKHREGGGVFGEGGEGALTEQKRAEEQI